MRQTRAMWDLLLEGGTLYDGLGGPAVRADLAVRADRVAAIGALSAGEARERLVVRGKVVCPGFIDIHSHSDAFLLVEPSAFSKILQGVTTEVCGQCGASAAPRLPGYPMPSDWSAQRYPGTWSTVAEYRALLEAQHPAVNLALLIGHNALRAGIMGYASRPATEDERRNMVRVLEQALDEGGAGLSTGLAYAPGMFATDEELQALARVVAKHDGLYASHMRSEGARLIEAIDETLAVARATSARAQVSHLKTSGPAHWHKLDDALERMRRARAEGLDAASDRYPYTASCTDLDIVLPDWASGDGREAVLARVRDPALRARLADELDRTRSTEDWNRVVVAGARHPDAQRFRGQSIADAAQTLQKSPGEAALDIMDIDELRTTAFFFGMSEANLRRILAEPWVAIGSDASLRAPTGPLSEDHPHPRAYGTFPRFLRMALDGQTVSLGEAIRKMTALPAERVRLKDRGVLRTGAFADVLVFDPARVRDLANYANPHQPPEGIAYVIVNGTVTVRDGRIEAGRGGRFLSPG